MVSNKFFRAPQLNMRRSKISPSKIANTGVNPYTGEYLSAGERKLLFQKRNVSSANVFKKSGALVKTTPSVIDSNVNISRNVFKKSGALVKTTPSVIDSNVNISRNVFKKSGALVKTTPSVIDSNVNNSKDENIVKSLEKRFSVLENIVKSLEKRFSVLEKTVYSISKALDNKSDDKILSKRVSILENDVSFLAKTLNKEAELEKKAQKQYEKDVEKVEEKKLRSGEEKKLEKKITKGLISPVKALGKKAGGVLGTLMELFMTLLGGWLTNQGLEAIKANAEGDINKLESIKNEVIKTLAIVGGIFLALNVGILGIIGTIGKIALAITLAPFKFAFNRIRDFFKGRTGGAKPGAKPGGGKPGGRPGGKPGGGRLGAAAGGSGGAAGNNRLNYGKNVDPTTGKPLRSNSSISRFNDSFSRKIQGKANLGDKARLFFRGGGKEIIDNILKRFTGSTPIQAIKGVLNFIKNSPGGKLVGWASNPFINFGKHALDLFKPENLKKIGTSLGKVGVLSRLLPLLFGVIDIKKRANQGMSPAQAIIPAILKTLMTSGAAILGGSVPIPGLNILTSFAGGTAGAWLGDKVMGGIDGIWDKSWDNNLFKGFNNTVMSIGEKDPTGLVSKIFPYEGKDKKYDSEAAPTAVSPPAASTPAANTSGGTESNPSLVKPTAQIASPSSPSMSVPGPVSGGGNTTVIYKKVGGSGGQMQGQSLKSGSATDVPLIASADPSNFYTMYSQLLYNVVG